MTKVSPAVHMPFGNQHFVPNYPPPDLQGLRNTELEEEPADDWHNKKYLGPSFPSMEREEEEQICMPRNLRVEQLELQDLLNHELQNVHKLENDISWRIYGTNKEAPVSLLDHQEVIYATQNPTFLAPDTKAQISVMKNVLAMMNTAKAHHQEILAKLDVPPAQRQSSRLQNKEKIDYRRFDKKGY